MTQDKGKLIHAHPANELTEKLFGFESVICERQIVDATGTSLNINSSTVPTGKIWKITHITAFNVDGDIATRFVFSLVHDGIGVSLHRKESATSQLESIDKFVELYLDADDYILAMFDGVASGETCQLSIFGYEMNAP